jgi:STE24 endopeptidase
MVPYFELFLGFSVVSFVVETWLSMRQHRCFHAKTVPAEVASAVKQDVFDKSQQYGLVRSSFGFFESTVMFVHSLALMLLGALPWLWGVSGDVTRWVGLDASNEMWQSIAFVVLAEFYSTLVHLPFELYSTFVIEQRFGFNKQSLALFFVDQLKSLGLMAVLGLPLLVGLLHIVAWGGPHFYFYVWLFVSAMSLFLMTIYPHVIAPLFNKFDPLPEGELRTAIHQLALQNKFPLTNLFVVDGSTRSSHSNAYFYGFWKNKRIVLYDTILQQLDQEGILAVLAHELGHWALNHNLLNLVLSEINIFVYFYLFATMIDSADLYASFGFSGDSRPVLIGLTLFSFIFEPAGHFIGFVMNVLSRRFEYQADAFAVQQGHCGLGDALVKTHAENLSSFVVDPYYSMYHNSHPTLTERLAAIDRVAVPKAKCAKAD